MRVHVDREACVGDETCVDMCPEIFQMDGDVATVKMEEVPPEFEGLCRDAFDACPVEAIIIKE
jgi:ferredoxin